MKKNLVIFDFDGVIADSLGFLFHTYMDFLDGFGAKGSKEEFDLLNGPKLSEIIAYLKEKHQLELPEEDLYTSYVALVSGLYDKVGLFPEIEESLAWLKSADCKIALASSCGRVDIDKVLDRYNLGHYFDFIASGDDVSKAKPEPDIYLLAKSKFEGYQTLVVEDSENGILAATAAGLPTVLYNPSNAPFAQKKDFQITSHSELRTIVADMGLSCITIAQADDIILELVDKDSAFDAEQLSKIEDVWNEELKRKQLFNGGIISYQSHELVDGKLTIKCFLAEYKQFLAQLKSADLDLGIAPVGVSGIIVDANDDTLLGVRNNVTEYSGFLEFVPAGSIDPKKVENGKIMFREQFIEEFEEETSIERSHVFSVDPFCLVLDEAHCVYDICAKIRIDQPLKSLLKSDQNDEYRDIKILPMKSIGTHLTPANCIPTSLAMLKNI